MHSALNESLGTNLDGLLDEICFALQLTQSQFDDAVKKYTAVGEWLSAPGSALVDFGPDIYPQGSMLLRTTVKPRSQDEFDLDLVCLLSGCRHFGPLEVYRMVEQRLRARKNYAEILEPKGRCLRLNYAGQFHLDIIPACSDLALGGTHLVVPDRRLKEWTCSNPKGFASWFESRCLTRERILAEKRIEPLEPERNPNGKPPLKRTVQLMKRHRDVVFNGNGNGTGNTAAPSSVLLTTLAGEEFGGQACCSDAMQAILNGIIRRFEENPGVIMRIVNPSHPVENFAEAWSWETYDRFRKFIYSFRTKFDRLRARLGLDEIADSLMDLFGEELTKRSVTALTERVSRARESGSLRFGGATVALTTAVSGSRLVPRNTFYGR